MTYVYVAIANLCDELQRGPVIDTTEQKTLFCLQVSKRLGVITIHQTDLRTTIQGNKRVMYYFRYISDDINYSPVI